MDANYAAQQREFDWLCEPSVMTRALRELRIGCDAGLAVDVGCGTSSGMADLDSKPSQHANTTARR